jgi:uncharacterized protein YndB with AHSA1/START domain
MSENRSVSATRVIAAPARTIFDLLADPRRHCEFDGSGTVGQVKKAPDRLSLGATFSMNMKIGISYLTRNKVVAFEENRVIAWHHYAQFVWRYDLEEVSGGTKVTESFDYSKPWGALIVPLGWPERNRLAMEATLARIEQLVTS